MKRTLIAATLAMVLGSVAAAQSGHELFQQALSKERAEGKLTEAIVLYQRIVKDFARDRELAAKALLRLGQAYQKLGDRQAQQAFERIVRDYADQKDAVGEARERLASLNLPAAVTARQTVRQLWAGDGVDVTATPSPDGRYLSFTDWETGDLALRDLVAGTNRRLTNTGGWVASGDYAETSLIAPDGRQLAYQWYVERENKNELRVLSIAPNDPARSKVVLRTERNDFVYPSAWTPDGKQLIVIRSLPDHTRQLGMVSMQDGLYRSLKSLDRNNPDRVTVSPDGRYIAYDVPVASDTKPHRDIVVTSADGSQETIVVQSPANDSSPLWSPDGSQLLFLSDRTGSVALWAMPMENGRPKAAATAIKTDVGPISLLGMTKSGALYYGVAGRTRRNVYVAELDAMRAVKPPVLATEQFVNANLGPAWSRDGRFLAYYSFRNPTVLVIRSASTDEERVIRLPSTVLSPFFAGPKWFPDNRTILILLQDAQGSGIAFYRLALDTGNTELVVQLKEGISSYDLSADGKAIFYIHQNPLTGRLMRFDIDDRHEVELKKNEWFISLAVSPDGTQLAYLKGVDRSLSNPSSAPAPRTAPSVVEVISTAGGQSREVFRADPWLTGARYNTLAWTPDQRYLLFVRDDKELWKVPAAGGQAEKVGIGMQARIKSPAVHRDGKRIVFAAIDSDNNEVWVLENFLPTVRASARR